MAGATFSRLKTWVHEKLKYSDLNAEFNNILNNLTPAGIDDLSATAAEMQGTAAPFPGSVLSQATSTAGEFQRLRYQVAAMLGNSVYWYEPPVQSIYQLNAALNALIIGQWLYEAGTPTYVSATSFTMTTDRTATFVPGLRLKAAVTAGTVYCTVVSAVSAGTPAVTTVTVINDSGNLDSGLSAILLGVLTPDNNALPMAPVVEKTGDYTVAKTDIGKRLHANKDTAIVFTLPAANTVPSGWWVDIVNIGAGALTLTGTVNGAADPVFANGGGCRLVSDGTAWHAIINNHTMTSTSHTGGNWKVFYTNASGVVAELALGTSGYPLLAQGASAAPIFGQVPTAGIGNLAVTEAKLAALAVSQAKLKTTTAEVTVGANNPLDYYTGIIPGGEYGFGINIKYASANGLGGAFLGLALEEAGALTTSYQTPKAKFHSADAETTTFYCQVRYVTSSGEVNWVMFLRNKATKFISKSYVSQDHPCMGSGGKPALTPHPFGEYDQDKYELIVINPTNEEWAAYEAAAIDDNPNTPDRSIAQVILEDYEIDEGSKAEWPTTAVTVGLPKTIEVQGKKQPVDWRTMPSGTSVTPIKAVIPKLESASCKKLKARKIK